MSYALTRRVMRVAAAAAVLCGVAACVLGPHKTDEQRHADQALADRVQAALDADQQLYARHITVRADGGVVLLTGYVWDTPDLEEARSTAEAVAGVTQVKSDLELQRNGIDNSGISR